MSFEVFVQCFAEGEPDGVPAIDVQAVFGSHLDASESDSWKVAYDELNSCDIYVTRLDSDPNKLTAITVHRPCGDPRLWDALYSLLTLGHFVLYFPAEEPPLLVADGSVADHLPEDMITATGRVTLVRSGSDIASAISAA